MGGVAWSEEEDNLLRRCVEQYGEGKWHRVPLLAGLNRCRKSCRLRWLNYLRPNIKRGSFNGEEVELILKLHNLLGNRSYKNIVAVDGGASQDIGCFLAVDHTGFSWWSLIAGRLPGRTANDVKNYWNCHLRKKFGAKETNKKKPINISGENIESAPLIVSSSLIVQPQNFKYGEGNTGKKQTTIMQRDERAEFAVQNYVESISHQESSTFLDEEVATGVDISSLDLQYSEATRKGCFSRWDWEDLILDIELWSESL